MVLDEPLEGDEVITKDGSTFLIDKILLERVQPVKVDFTDTDGGAGYIITSSLSAGGGCGGGSCSC